MKRFGRTVLGMPTAREFAFDATLTGSDHSDRAGDCNQPLMRPFTGLADKALSRLADWKTNPAVDHAPGFGIVGSFREPNVRHVDVAVRCRKCPACLRARARMWRYRARLECARAPRTWFSTFTLSPERQFRCLAEVESKSFASSFEGLQPGEIFKERCKPIVVEFQRYCKRLRKEGCGLRYMLIIEKHASGLPHLHALMHETDSPIRHRQLNDQWTWGFSTHKLIPSDDNGKAAAYVCKYLSKEMASRVRASTQYGRS